MIEYKELSKARVAIVGLGLMGGSLAMALKNKCELVLGVDTDPETISYALENGIVERASTKIDELLQVANVIILAVPVRSILQIIRELPAYHPEGAIVMDIGSTKRAVTAALNELPEQFDPIGGHPMCGKENLTIFNADPQIFQDAAFAFSPLERTTEKARLFACQLAECIGAKQIVVEAETHDDWTAATSHLPFLLSMALAHSTPAEVAPLVGPGFKGNVRLAGTPGSMMLDVLRTNQDNVLKHCENYIAMLTTITKLIEASEFEKLSELIETGRLKKEYFTKGGKQ